MEPVTNNRSASRCYLVTGAAGFIASKVCEFLLADGHTIVGIDNLNDYYDIRLKLYRLGQIAREAGMPEAEVIGYGLSVDSWKSVAPITSSQQLITFTAGRFIITTNYNLRPGLIALLYLLRWKIEKTYDVFKNKLLEQKAWANGATAHLCQAHFIFLLYNLLVLLQARLEQAGIYKLKVEQKAAPRRKRSCPPTRWCAMPAC